MKNCNQRDEDTSIANRPSGLVEVFGVPMKAAKTLANALGDLKRTEKGAAVLNKINKLFPPTQGIVDMLVANGFPQAKKINDYFKKSRAKTEFYLRRATERVIEPMMALKTADLRSFEMLSELANESSVYKINPFNSRSKYENQEFEFRNETGRVEKQDGGILWDRVNTKLNALRDRNPKAVTALKNLFDEYEFFRNQFLDGLVKQVKVRSGEVNVPDSQTKPETFEAITQIKNGFAEADADAYIAFLRQGNHTVNTYELEPIYQTDEATGDREIVSFKRLPEVLKNESFLSQREADTYIEAEKIRLAQEYQKQIKGSPEAQQKVIEAALEYITKSDQVNRETGQGIAIAGNFSNNLDRVKQALKKTIHQLDPNLADDVRLARQKEIEQNMARIDTMLKQLFPETSVRSVRSND